MRIDAILFGEVVNTTEAASTAADDDEQMQIVSVETNTTEIIPVIPFNSFLRGEVRSGDEIKQMEILDTLSRQLVSALKESVNSVNLSEVKITYDGPRNLFTISAVTFNSAADSEVPEVAFAQRELILQRVRELEGTEYNLGCVDDSNNFSSTHKFIFRLAEIQSS